jgi:hypothetical protein
MYLASSGRTGLDTTTPLSKLHIVGHVSESHSGSLFRVEGSSGSLFEVTDSLSGSLMSVNDVSGLPILEVFDDDRVVMGTFNQNTLVVTGSRVGIGTSTPVQQLHIYDINGTSYARMRLQGSTTSHGGLLDFYDSAGSQAEIYSYQDTLYFGMADEYSFDSKIGIGITNPAYPLVVRGNPATIELQDSGNSDKSWRIINDTSDLTFTETGVAGHVTFKAGGNVELLTTTAQLLLPLSNDAATPTLAFGDGDTGFYESTDDTLVVSSIGIARFIFGGNDFRSMDSAGPKVRNVSATSTVPTFMPNQADTDTGIG